MSHITRFNLSMAVLIVAMFALGGCNKTPSVLDGHRPHNAAPIQAPICPICGQPELPEVDDCGKPPGHKGPHGNKGHHYGQFKVHNHPLPHSNG